MPRINRSDTLGGIIEELQSRISKLENAQRSAVAVVALDPANARDGDKWIRTADQTLRVQINGVVRTVTVT